MKNLLIAFFLCRLFSGSANAQVKISGNDNDVLLLQLSSSFLYVAKETRIDMDSTLIVTSVNHHLSRIPIITEGFDSAYPMTNFSWMDHNDLGVPLIKLKQSTGKERTRLQLALGAYYAFRPGRDNAENAMAKSYLIKTKAASLSSNLENWVIQADILLGKCYFKSGAVDSGKLILQQAIDYATRSGNYKLAAKAHYYIGAYCPFSLELLPYRIEHLEQALSLYKQLNDKVNGSNTLMDIAYQNFAIGKLDDSEKSLNETINLQKSMGFRYTHYSTDLLALIFRLKSNFAKELIVARDGVKNIELTEDSLGLGYFYARIGESYNVAENHMEESNFWYQKALDEFLKDGADPTLYRIFSSKEFIEYSIRGKKPLLDLLNKLLTSYPPVDPIDLENAYIAIAACNQRLKLYHEAEKYLLKAEKLESQNQKSGRHVNQFYVYLRLGELYAEIKDHKKNRFYNEKFVRASKDPIFLTSAYWNLFRADSALDGFSQLNNLYQYTLLREKAYNKDRNKLVEELDVKYKTLQKQKDLDAYEAKDRLQTEQAASIQKFSIAGLIVLLLTIAMIWARYIGKQKSNRLLQLQKEEISLKNEQLEAVINEKDDLLISKEWLLKEVHHRVKNNLQLVMSLLNSQTTYLKDEVALNAVMESRHRVQAMSLIHQKLYKSDNASSINMRDYIKDLVEYLKDSFKTRLTIYFELQIDSVELDVSQAIPVGLILNELITNAIKYAFPFTQEDRISISFRQNAADGISLIFTDNGRGLPEEFDKIKNKSFGMRLIQGLTEDLGGEFKLDSVNGTSVTMIFKTADFYHTELN